MGGFYECMIGECSGVIDPDQEITTFKLPNPTPEKVYEVQM